MDDYERTTTRVTTEAIIPAELVVPLAAEPVSYAPVAAAPIAAAPVHAAQPVLPAAAMPARPMVADRVVTQHETVNSSPSGLEMTRLIVGLGFGILQSLLIIRIILLLLVANRENDIVQLILGVTAPFVNPFRDMFALNQLGSRGSVLDVAAIVALVGWTLIELLIIAILNLGLRRGRTAVY